MAKTRKLVLMGCRESAWVSSRGMRAPRAVVRGVEGAQVEVHTSDDFEVSTAVLVTVPGTVDLPRANWTRALVVGGDHDSVLCTIED